MNEVAEKLQKVREILSNPGHWTKGDFGNWNDETKRGAVCLLGACLYATTGDIHELEDGSDEDYLYKRTARELLACLPDYNSKSSFIDFIAVYNDKPETTHEDVLKVIDCAIHKVTEEGLVGV